MKKVILGLLIFVICTVVFAQQFSIPAGAVLLESTEFKDNGVPYVIEQRYKLTSGEIMYAYYNVEGGNSVTVQRLEQAPILSLGVDINIPGMPGYREFEFGSDTRKLVQFMKLFKLREPGCGTPSLSDPIFSKEPEWGKDSSYHVFRLLLDLYDETWVLEHITRDDHMTEGRDDNFRTIYYYRSHKKTIQIVHDSKMK